MHVQRIKSMGNRQTFHPKNLDYDSIQRRNRHRSSGFTRARAPPEKALVAQGQASGDILLTNALSALRSQENLFGWDLMYHDIHSSDLLREPKVSFQPDPLDSTPEEHAAFDPRLFRPLMVNLRVALHQITLHLIHVSDLSDVTPIREMFSHAAYERRTVSHRILRTSVRGNEHGHQRHETASSILTCEPVRRRCNRCESIRVRSATGKSRPFDSATSPISIYAPALFKLSGLIIRGHSMLSHEGLPPERETLEYAWQMEILLGKVSARVTTIQVRRTFFSRITPSRLIHR